MWLPGSHSLEANATELLHSYYSQTNIIACQSLTTHSLTTYWQVCRCHTSWMREREALTQTKTHLDRNTPTRIRSHFHTVRTLPTRHAQRTPGRGESSSSAEVERKPIGQIRFFRFLTELSINLQRCTVIRHDLGLSQRSVLECSERLLIRPGGHGVYDDITQPLSLYTRPSVSLSPNLPSPLPFIPSQLQGEEVASQLKWLLT